MSTTHDDIYGDNLGVAVIPTNLGWKWPKNYKGLKPEKVIEIAACESHCSPTILIFTAKQARKIAKDLAYFAMLIEDSEEKK